MRQPDTPHSPQKKQQQQNLSFASEGQKEIPKIFPHFLKKVKQQHKKKPRQKKAPGCTGCSGCYSYLFMASSFALPRSLSLPAALFAPLSLSHSLKHMLHLPPSVVDELHYMLLRLQYRHAHTHTHEKLERGRTRESEAVANVERPMPNGHPLVAAIYLLVLLVAWPPPARLPSIFLGLRLQIPLCCCSSRIDTNSILHAYATPFPAQVKFL